MALDGSVVRLDVIQARGVDDRGAGRPGDVIAPRAVALFAAHVPLGDSLGLRVVVDRVTTVTERAGRSTGILAKIHSGPPVGAHANVICAPYLVRHVPLCRKREVVVSLLLEIALFPLAPVSESDVFPLKR